MNNSNTVSAELGLRLVAPQQTTVTLDASFLYSREDPYAVRIVFRAELEEPVEWTLARDLLSTGMERHEGPGDVAVWPSAASEDGAPGSVLHIELSSPFGQAHFEAPAAEISEFLRRTYEIVAAGEEAEHMDVEAGLNDLLRQAS
jgi:hypothetical protein